MRYVFLGMGAVGSLWGAMLNLAGFEVYGVARGKHFDRIVKNGLIYEDLSGNTIKLNKEDGFHVVNNPSALENAVDFEPDDTAVFITVKTYSLDEIIEQYGRFIENIGKVILLQNGVGNESTVASRLDVGIIRGITTIGAYLVEPGRVRHTGKGFAKFGVPRLSKSDNAESLSEFLKKVVADLQKAGIDASIIDNIDKAVWEKIFVNIGINALAAINNIPNGKLLESEEFKEKMRAAITEAWKVAVKLGIEVDDTPDPYIELTFDVARKTAANRNSMLQDLMKGRPTEIDFINGKIVEYGKKLGIETPVNSYLTETVRKLERRDR